MKNFISGSRIIAAALFVLVACIFGCSSGESHIIKMRLAKGDVFVQNTTMKMDMKMMGMDMKMDVETGVSFEVMKKSEAETELKMTYTKMHSTMNMSGQPTGLPNTDSLINAPGKRIVGKSVMMKISTDNKITAITGIEDILMDPTADSATRKMMEKMFSKEQMGNLFGMIFSMYPKQAVKIGESWNAETNASMGGANMKIAMKYTLLSVKDGLADIGVTGIINGKGDMETGGMKIQMDMKGGQKGNMVVNMADGYLKTSSYKMDLDADMNMMGQKLSMTMNADYGVSGN